MTERKSPLQNRVTPFGEIIATPERGTLMGNRGGCLHTASKELMSRRWVSSQWITCLLEFRGRKREVMSPGLYTELFFLDEPTAFAAGHRPCFECRRTDAKRFFEDWRIGNPAHAGEGVPKVATVDAVLQGDRVRRGREKVTYEAPVRDLPNGTMVERIATPKVAWLVWQGQLWQWSPGGYVGSERVDAGERVQVLTPRSTVKAFAAGYAPVVHPSAAL